MFKKPKVILALLALLLIIPGLFLFIPQKFSLNYSKIFRSTSSTPQSRSLELGTIKSKTNSVKNEPKVILNDPALSQAWGVEKSNALKAWEISQGSDQIIVAVIDTGCDLKHEDLNGNYWSNPGEQGIDGQGRDKNRNRIDDDNNGFIDDEFGWNFSSNNADLSDNHGHGTHIAGIIGARSNNGKGIVGVSPNVRIMCLKYFDPKVNSDHLKNTIAAIHYAVKMGAHIINYSGGGLEPSIEEKAAIQLAQEKGILFVAAAGNERSNSDVKKYYPADYGLDNIISVTAINPDNQVLASSNYGTETVDLAAPGQGILSTLPDSQYGLMTGTSQATAFVTGAAVLVKAHHKDFNYLEVKKYILSTGDVKDSLASKTRSSRQLNLFKSLVMMDQTLSLTGLKGSSRSDQSVTIEGAQLPGQTTNQIGIQDLSQFNQEILKKIKKQTREAAGQ